MTFKAIDTQLIIDTANRTAANNGLDLKWSQSGGGIFRGRFGDTIVDPSGSRIQPMLFLRNINDGGHALMVGVGLYRFVCANGLVVGDNFYSQRVIHREGPTLEDFISNLEIRLNRAFEVGADAFTDSIEKLANTAITDIQGLNIIASLGLPDGINRYAQYYWVNPARPEEQSRNLYTLYNVVNEMNRRRSGSEKQEFNREISLLQNIEALYDHEQFLLRKAA